MSEKRRIANLRIRPWQADDAEPLHRLVQESLPSLAEWLPWCRDGYSGKDAHNWIAHCRQAWEKQNEFQFAITDAHYGDLLGGVGLNQLVSVRASANLGYWVGAPFRGNGFAAQAARMAAMFGFHELGLFRIVISILPENTSSLAAAAKTGAKREGIARNGIIDGGTPKDAWTYSLIPSDLA